jgi:putative tryptophan/tyrosine transport system substrate-binding protein
MRRRDLLLGGLAAATVARRALAQTEVRRIGVLTGLGEDDPATLARLTAFREGLARLGWIEGRNLATTVRYNAGNIPDTTGLIAELLAANPEILVVQAPGMAAARLAAPSLPIVFVLGSDPVRNGWVASLAHPGGNITGFSANEPSFGPKWLELLKDVAPAVRRVAVIEPQSPNNFAPIIAAAADRFSVSVVEPVIQTPTDLETAIGGFAEGPDGGLILPINAFTAIHRKPIIQLSLRYKLPLVTGNPPFPADGGLLYYGADIGDIYGRAATYVDRILRGAKPGELPVQQPTKYSLVINLKTAKALSLSVPQMLLAQADEVIE